METLFCKDILHSLEQEGTKLQRQFVTSSYSHKILRYKYPEGKRTGIERKSLFTCRDRRLYETPEN